jgi:tripartite-type tricarboxylate transporter receptor subunit TctC
MRWTYVAITLTAVCGAAGGQSYPSKPVRLIAPFAPGGGLDATARLIAQRLTLSFGQSVIVDNRPAVDGIVGTELVAKANPDGHTLLMVNMSHAINAAVGKKLPYDTLKDFAPITQTNNQQLLLVVIPSLPVKSVMELIELLKAKPGALSYGSSSNAVALPMELFKSMTGTAAVHIPYKGTGPMLNDMLGGQVQLAFGASISTVPQVKAGRLRALAIGDSKRSAQMPELPTIAEAGVPGYQAMIWNGVLAPAKTPTSVVELLNREIVRIVRSAEFRARMEVLGSDVVGSTPAEWGRFIADEITKWSGIAKAAGLKPDA